MVGGVPLDCRRSFHPAQRAGFCVTAFASCGLVRGDQGREGDVFMMRMFRSCVLLHPRVRLLPLFAFQACTLFAMTSAKPTHLQGCIQPLSTTIDSINCFGKSGVSRGTTRKPRCAFSDPAAAAATEVYVHDVRQSG